VSTTLRFPLGQWNAEMERGEWDVVYSAMSGHPEIFCLRQDGEYDVCRGSDGSFGKHIMVSTSPYGRVDRCPVDAVPALLGPRRKDGKQRVTVQTRI
jgi:hypothetical protein